MRFIFLIICILGCLNMNAQGYGNPVIKGFNPDTGERLSEPRMVLPAPHNPILTQFKQKTQKSQIQGIGHADFVQAHDDSWWLVCLGFRIQGGQLIN